MPSGRISSVESGGCYAVVMDVRITPCRCRGFPDLLGQAAFGECADTGAEVGRFSTGGCGSRCCCVAEGVGVVRVKASSSVLRCRPHDRVNTPRQQEPPAVHKSGFSFSSVHPSLLWGYCGSAWAKQTVVFPSTPCIKPMPEYMILPLSTQQSE